jgi:hypothetical protein
MEKEFVTYEQALALQDLGFDDTPWFSNQASLYDVNGEHTMYTNYGVMYSGLSDGYISAPLKQQVFRWFREKYNLWSYVYPYIHDKDWHFHIQFYNSEMWGEVHLGNKFNTYEEAENACIDKLIKLCKHQAIS